MNEEPTGQSRTATGTDAGATAAQGTAGAPKARRRWRRWLGVAGLLTAVGAVGACHHGGWHEGGWHRHGWHAGAGGDPQALARRIDRGLERVLSAADASDEQKARAREIARKAIDDLAALRGPQRDSRRRAAELLSAPAIDRVAIEALRAETLARADQASRRVSAALADLAEVLTPEQRGRLKSRFDARFGGGA